MIQESRGDPGVLDHSSHLATPRPRLGDAVRAIFHSPPPQLVLFDFQRSLQHFLRFGSSDRNVARDLFISSDTEGSDGVASFGSDGGLTSELFEHFGSSSESISRFSDRDVYTVYQFKFDLDSDSKKARSSRSTNVVAGSSSRRLKGKVIGTPHSLITNFSIRSSFIGLTAAVLSACKPSQPLSRHVIAVDGGQVDNAGLSQA